MQPEWSIETTTPLPGDQRTPASQGGAGRKALTRPSTVTLILGSGTCDRGQSTVIGASSNGLFESTGTSRPERRLFFFIYLLLGLCSGAPLFEGFGLPLGRPHPVWATVVDLSSRSMFNLFGVWSLRPPSGDDLTVTQQAETALLHASPLVGVLTRLASSAQSVLAGMLLFLVALAARRRFQIS